MERRAACPFDLLTSFSGPETTEDGKPYGPIRYKEIVKELYAISKACNTSYTDLLKITPTEKNYMIEFMLYEKEQAEKAMNDIKNNNKQHY